jgi:NAD(P)-dependent dehydrogenase (short-subunit alcohol dehydrogenase family)
MNIENKTCLVTGANSGIGKYTAQALVRRGAYVVMLCRNEEKAERARQQIMEETGQSGVEILLADLAHQYDIRKAAERFCDRFDALDILINNAGIIPSGRNETPEGIERTLAINHLGPFLLTNLLMEPLQNAPAARVVNVASEVHRLGAAIFDIDNLQLKTGYSPVKAYGLSKLCNIMFTHELAKRTADTAITANALHPGVVSTQLAEEASVWMKLAYFMGKPFMRSPKSGAQTSIFLATSEEASGTSGKYFKNKKVASPASLAYDDELTQKLWEKSDQLCGLGSA